MTAKMVITLRLLYLQVIMCRKIEYESLLFLVGYRSFACFTIQQRLPTIITKIIDSVTRDKNELIGLFGGDVIDSIFLLLSFLFNEHNIFFDLISAMRRLLLIFGFMFLFIGGQI